MRVGLAFGTPYETLDAFQLELDIAHAAGADSIWIPDHLAGIFHPQLWDGMSYGDAASSPDAFPDPLTLAGVLSGRTELPIGTAVVDATRRRAPDMIRAALTAHHLSPAGFRLGIGSGEAENLVPFGYPFDAPAGALEQFLIEARSLLDDGRMPAPLDGAMGLRATRPDGSKLQIWVAAHGPRALRLVGTYADGWISIFVDSATFRQQREVITEHAARAGRSVPPARLMVLTVFGESRDEVVARFEAEPLAKLVAMLAPAELWTAFGLEKPGAGTAGYRDMVLHHIDPQQLANVAPKVPVEMLEAFGLLLGNGHEIAAQLEPHQEAGVDQLMVVNLSGFLGGLERVAATRQELVDLMRLLDAGRG